MRLAQCAARYRATADSENPAAVLIGLDSMQGLGAARVLASRGVPVIALAKDPHHDSCKTRVCRQIITTNTETEELIQTLEELGRTLARKAVLVPCEDANVLLVSRHRQRLEPWFHVMLPDPDVVEMLMDKTSFYSYAAEHGFPIPATHLIRNRQELEDVMGTLTFPCILKPANSATGLWERNVTVSAFRVADAASLRELYDAHHQLTDVLIVQQWIEGADSDLYSCNTYFGADSEPLVSFTARKLRQWPPHVGKSCLGEECRAEPVLAETVKLLRAVRYKGLGYVEFKRDARTGEYFIIEPNVGRPTGRSAIAEAGGVELLFTMYCDALGRPLPQNRQQTYGGVKWIHLRHDFQSALYYRRRKELTVRQWWHSWQGKKAYALFSLSDPGPFLSDLWRVFRLAISPRRRRQWTKPLRSTP